MLRLYAVCCCKSGPSSMRYSCPSMAISTLPSSTNSTSMSNACPISSIKAMSSADSSPSSSTAASSSIDPTYWAKLCKILFWSPRSWPRKSGERGWSCIHCSRGWSRCRINSWAKKESNKLRREWSKLPLINSWSLWRTCLWKIEDISADTSLCLTFSTTTKPSTGPTWPKKIPAPCLHKFSSSGSTRNSLNRPIFLEKTKTGWRNTKSSSPRSIAASTRW